MSTTDQRDAARSLTLRCGYASAAVAAIPIPFSATLGVAPIHLGMVLGLGRIYGIELGRESAMALVARIGATAGALYLGSRLAMGLGKIVFPVLPGLIGAPLIFANTLAIGAVARAHFDGDGELDDEAVRAIYNDALKKAKTQFDPSRARSPEARAAAQRAVEDAQTDAPDEA